MALTSIKDVDLKILSELDDRELFTICNSKDVYIHRICKDENFWRNRLLKKYGPKAVELKPQGRSWKNHYLQMIIDLDKFTNFPEKFLRNILWSPKGTEFIKYTAGDESKVILSRINEYTPFLQAPEWVITNYYFLKIPKYLREGKLYTSITPEEIFEILRPLADTPDTFISGSGISFPQERGWWGF